MKALLVAASLWLSLQGTYTTEDVHEAINYASARYGVSWEQLDCTVYWETDETYDPYSVGDNGYSLGPAQIHLYGLRKTFHNFGYTDVYSPRQSISFLARMIKRGYGYFWTPILIGRC